MSLGTVATGPQMFSETAFGHSLKPLHHIHSKIVFLLNYFLIWVKIFLVSISIKKKAIKNIKEHILGRDDIFYSQMNIISKIQA